VRQAFGYRLVFGRADQDDVAAGFTTRAQLAHRTQGREHGRLDAFGGTAVEHQAAVPGADHPARTGAHALAQRPGAQARCMAAARIAEAVLHGGHGGGSGGGQYRGRGIGVEVNFGLHE
jgi:hypothetical protein